VQAKAIGNAVKMGVTVLALSTIFMNFALAGSIKLMATFLEHAQIIALLPCMAFKFPAFLGVLFRNLRKINLVIYESEAEGSLLESLFGEGSLQLKHNGYKMIGFPTSNFFVNSNDMIKSICGSLIAAKVFHYLAKKSKRPIV